MLCIRHTTIQGTPGDIVFFCFERLDTRSYVSNRSLTSHTSTSQSHCRLGSVLTEPCPTSSIHSASQTTRGELKGRHAQSGILIMKTHDPPSSTSQTTRIRPHHSVHQEHLSRAAIERQPSQQREWQVTRDIQHGNESARTTKNHCLDGHVHTTRAYTAQQLP